jgi:YHS domain-containing protein
VNEFCPVQPERKGSPAHSTTYRGKQVQFCCRSCQAAFLANPQAYLEMLPQFSPEEVAAAKTAATMPMPAPTPNAGWLDFDLLNWSAEKVATYRTYLGIYLAYFLLFLIANRLRARVSAETKVTRPKRLYRGLIAVLASPALLIILVELGVIVELVRRPREVVADAVTRASGAIQAVQYERDMYQEALIEARAALPKRLKAIYYRGNDERTPKLFNNGDYRTAVFHVSIRTDRARDIDYGDNLAGRKLFLRLQIDRAPFAAEGFFLDEPMSRVVLAPCVLSPTGPAPDRERVVKLTIVKSKECWEASYPLGNVSSEPVQELDGTLLLCANFYGNENSPQYVHYGIRYHLALTSGKVAPESHLWMAPLFFTNRHLNNWFNHEPIPVLPHKNTDDPVLLGLDKVQRR